MRGRLNLFQAAMLRWRELYPYNAVHVAELPGVLDADRLEQAISEQLAALGVTGLVLDARARRFEYGGGAVKVAVQVLPGSGEALRIIEDEMERQLNLPFAADGAYEPFRFFAAAAGERFHLGVAYDHFIAGGDSIVSLLKAIAARYEGGVPAASEAVELYPATYGRLFTRNALAFYLGQYSLPGMLLRARRAFRPRYPYGDDWRNGFTSFELPPDLYAAIVRTARAWSVTRNDLLLAMLLDALAPEVPERLHARRRREIAIASVINIRQEFVTGTEQAFGQFLSSFLISHPVPAGVTLEALARDIHAQTQRVKRRKLYLQTLYLIACGGLVWSHMTPGQRKQMYAKNYPVWAGMSMLNVEAIWNESPGTARVFHYLRAVSTGPFSPMVMAPASVGDCLHIGVSYRTSAFSRDDMARIGAALVQCAHKLV
ncbi:MAG: hypothetical protein IT521_05450 [Burkholderiales bacterium]|nr:hypothetical protein [Burkholderiales bacterium]